MYKKGAWETFYVSGKEPLGYFSELRTIHFYFFIFFFAAQMIQRHKFVPVGRLFGLADLMNGLLDVSSSGLDSVQRSFCSHCLVCNPRSSLCVQ